MSVVTPTILSDGAAMDSTYQLLSIDVVKEVNRIPYAHLVLLDGSAAQQKFAISDQAFFEPGKEIEIKLRYEDAPGSDASVFKGLVVKHTVEAGAQGSLLSVELKDAALKLSRGRKSQVFIKKSDDTIIGELIGAAGLKKGKLPATQPQHEQLVQYYCSDWDFILSRAEACGLLTVAEDGEVSLAKIEVSGQAKFSFEYGLSEIYEFEYEVDAGHQYGNIESIAWDLKSQKLTKASKARSFSLSQGNLHGDALANSLGAKLQTLSSPVPLDPKALQAWADGRMAQSRMSLLRGHVSVPGLGKLKRLDVIEIAGVGKRFNGKTIVTGVHHRVDRDGWRSDVQFGLPSEAFAAQKDIRDVPAAGLLPAVNGLQIGIVDKFEEDPDKEFRVKVILPGIDESKGQVWARLASPDAGKERGFFFRPETGDEVIVGFFNDDPGQAVVLGAMYGSKNKPPKSMSSLSQDNLNKGIVTKKGTTIAFIDNDKSSVYIETAAKNKILLDDDAETISLVDQHGNSIKMSKDGIVLKSAKDFKIEASGNVDIKGSKVDIK